MRDRVVFMLVLVALLWAVEIVDHVVSGIRYLDFTPERGVLDRHGIHPRESYGLIGIVFAPFLHGGWQHLIGNTVPFFVLGLLVMLSGIPSFLGVTAVIAVIGGLGTWMFGGDGTVHIGASGLIFGYLGFVLTRGIFTRSIPWILVGLGVGAFYWWMITALMKFEEGVSWQGHAFGFAGGIMAAWMIGKWMRRKGMRVPAVLDS